MDPSAISAIFTDPVELKKLTKFAEEKGGIGKAIANQDVLAQNDNDLMFISGEEIIVLKKLFDKQYLGYCEGVIGVFDINTVYIQGKLKELRPSRRHQAQKSREAIKEHNGDIRNHSKVMEKGGLPLRSNSHDNQQNGLQVPLATATYKEPTTIHIQKDYDKVNLDGKKEHMGAENVYTQVSMPKANDQSASLAPYCIQQPMLKTSRQVDSVYEMVTVGHGSMQSLSSVVNANDVLDGKDSNSHLLTHAFKRPQTETLSNQSESSDFGYQYPSRSVSPRKHSGSISTMSNRSFNENIQTDGRRSAEALAKSADVLQVDKKQQHEKSQISDINTNTNSPVLKNSDFKLNDGIKPVSITKIREQMRQRENVNGPSHSFGQPRCVPERKSSDSNQRLDTVENDSRSLKSEKSIQSQNQIPLYTTSMKSVTRTSPPTKMIELEATDNASSITTSIESNFPRSQSREAKQSKTIPNSSRARGQSSDLQRKSSMDTYQTNINKSTSALNAINDNDISRPLFNRSYTSENVNGMISTRRRPSLSSIHSVFTQNSPNVRRPATSSGTPLVRRQSNALFKAAYIVPRITVPVPPILPRHSDVTASDCTPFTPSGAYPPPRTPSEESRRPMPAPASYLDYQPSTVRLNDADFDIVKPHLERLKDSSSASSSESLNKDINSETSIDDYGFVKDPEHIDENGLRMTAIDAGDYRQRELKWVKIMTEGDKNIRDSRKMKKLVRSGIPPSVRGRAWQFLASSHLELERIADNEAAEMFTQNSVGLDNNLNTVFIPLYEKLYMSTSDDGAPEGIMDEIDLDIERCYPDHVLFRSNRKENGEVRIRPTGLQDLHNILRAYAKFNPEVGYCQGMGRLVGLMLMQMPAEEAFWLMVSTVRKYLPAFFTPSMEQLQDEALIFKWLLEEKESKLSKHLAKNEVEPLMYITQWFATLFTMSLPWDSVLRVWDIFYLEGVRFLHRVGIAIFQIYRQHLLKKCPTLNELLTFIQHLPLSELHMDVIIPAALRVKFSETHYQKLVRRAHNVNERDTKGLLKSVSTPINLRLETPVRTPIIDVGQEGGTWSSSVMESLTEDKSRKNSSSGGSVLRQNSKGYGEMIEVMDSVTSRINESGGITSSQSSRSQSLSQSSGRVGDINVESGQKMLSVETKRSIDLSRGRNEIDKAMISQERLGRDNLPLRTQSRTEINKNTVNFTGSMNDNERSQSRSRSRERERSRSRSRSRSSDDRDKTQFSLSVSTLSARNRPGQLSGRILRKKSQENIDSGINVSPLKPLEIWNRLERVPFVRIFKSRIFVMALRTVRPFVGSLDIHFVDIRKGYVAGVLKGSHKVCDSLGNVNEGALVTLGEIISYLAIMSSFQEGDKMYLVKIEANYFRRSKGPITAAASFKRPNLNQEDFQDGYQEIELDTIKLMDFMLETVAEINVTIMFEGVNEKLVKH